MVLSVASLIRLAGDFRRAEHPGDLTVRWHWPRILRTTTDGSRCWASAFRTSVAKLRESIATRARALPLARHAWARYRRRRYEQRIRRFIDEKTGRADRLPMGAVYEATMRCNLHCEFCYVGDLLNIEGQWREEMTLDALRKAFPDDPGLQVSLTGGEIFMRKDIMSVLDLFREKGYACGYLTTNGTIITEERAEALADLAAAGFLRHISVSIDGPGAIHDAARGLKGTFERTCAGLKRLQAAARRKQAPLRDQHQHDRRARESRCAGRDGGRRRGTRRRRHRLESSDVQHARRSRRDGPAHRRRRFVGDRDVHHSGSGSRHRRGAGQKVGALQEKCRRKNVLFDFRPKVHPQLIDNYYTPGAKLEGRCLYPFLHARVSFSGKVYFCPFIRVEVGDLSHVVARGSLERRAVCRYAPSSGRERNFSGLSPLLQGRIVSNPACRAFRGRRAAPCPGARFH